MDTQDRETVYWRANPAIFADLIERDKKAREEVSAAPTDDKPQNLS